MLAFRTMCISLIPSVIRTDVCVYSKDTELLYMVFESVAGPGQLNHPTPEALTVITVVLSGSSPTLICVLKRNGGKKMEELYLCISSA